MIERKRECGVILVQGKKEKESLKQRRWALQRPITFLLTALAKIKPCLANDVALRVASVPVVEWSLFIEPSDPSKLTSGRPPSPSDEKCSFSKHSRMIEEWSVDSTDEWMVKILGQNQLIIVAVREGQ